jgi:hypothetical protein
MFGRALRRSWVTGALCCLSVSGWADIRVTRAYQLTNVEVSNISRVINIAFRDSAATRIIAGDGKHLVITDSPDQQFAIAQLLPYLDQPMDETNPDKIQMKMLMNAAAYLRRQKIANKVSSSSGGVPRAATSNAPDATSSRNVTGGVATYDKFSPSVPYKSIYASDDAKLLKKPRMYYDEPALPSLSALQLKGIFKLNSVSRVALLSYASSNYMARDGGLYENNHQRVKDVTSTVLKDRVILVGPDHIPREIKFKSSL